MSFFQLTQGAALACAGLGAAAATTRTRAMYRFWTTSQVGTRDLIYMPIPEVVFDDLRGRTADQKTTVDQLAADLLAIATGHPKAVRHLDRLDMLRLASATLFATVDGVTTGTHGRCTE